MDEETNEETNNEEYIEETTDSFAWTEQEFHNWIFGK